jgi:hypothetical protein
MKDVVDARFIGDLLLPVRLRRVLLRRHHDFRLRR